MYSGQASDHEPPDALALELVSGLAPGRALDVGCGAGGLLVALAQRGWAVSGVDVASKAIEATKAVLTERGLSAQLFVGDAVTWTPPHRYELVTSTFALPTELELRTQQLRWMADAVAPGGTMLLKEFDVGMKRHDFLSDYDLPTLAELTAAVPGWTLERAEVVQTPPHDHDGSGTFAGQHWTAAIVWARKP